jgi:hypothetical protein
MSMFVCVYFASTAFLVYSMDERILRRSQWMLWLAFLTANRVWGDSEREKRAGGEIDNDSAKRPVLDYSTYT